MLGDEAPEMFGNTIAGDVRDPYPKLAVKRRTSPVEWTKSYTGFDAVTLYRYDEVAAVLRDDDTWSAAAAKALYGDVMGEFVMVGMDEPEHRRYRALVSPAFQNRVLARWEDGLIRPVIERVVERLDATGRVDLIREFTAQFPVRVIAGILGLPESDYAQFQRWSMAIINAAAGVDAARRASADVATYFGAILEDRRKAPTGDLVGELAIAEIEGERLSDEEIYSFLRLLLPAGVETTYRSSGSLLLGLLQNPDQLGVLRADRTKLPAAIEEGLRWEAPVLLTTRIARHDTEVAGVAVPEGSWMVAHLGSANRDENRWEDPESFNILREVRPNMAFGHGPHMCLGLHLARREVRVALDVLLDHFADIRLDPGDDDPHVHGRIFRSPNCLPVRLA